MTDGFDSCVHEILVRASAAMETIKKGLNDGSVYHPFDEFRAR